MRTKELTGAHSRSLSHTVRPEPPEFEIVGFMDHINVTVKFPPVTPKIYGESIWEVLGSKSFVIEEQAGKNVKVVSASSGSDQSDAKLAVDFPHYLFKSCVKPGEGCTVVFSVMFDTQPCGERWGRGRKGRDAVASTVTFQPRLFMVTPRTAAF